MNARSVTKLARSADAPMVVPPVARYSQRGTANVSRGCLESVIPFAAAALSTRTVSIAAQASTCTPKWILEDPTILEPASSELAVSGVDSSASGFSVLNGEDGIEEEEPEVYCDEASKRP
jgi:hypothetical protein